MIAVVIPAHNESALARACVESVIQAGRDPQLNGEAVVIFFVSDSCTDDTSEIIEGLGLIPLVVSFRNVGKARAAGAAEAIKAGARWLAFTDADTVVARDWLAAQLRQESHAVCGTVAVADWGDYGEHMKEHFGRSYDDRDGHRHIHGANLGVCTNAYLRVGGFQPLESSQDVALVTALIESGETIAWSAAPRVVTSARRNFRAPDGFGATLGRVDADAQSCAGAAC